MQRDGEHGGGFLHHPRHLDVGPARARVARGVVVAEDQGGGVHLQRALDHLARIDGRVVHRAARLRLVGDQAVLAVEVEDAEHLRLLPRHGGGEVFDQPVPGVEDGALHHLRAGHAERGGLNELHRRDAVDAEAARVEQRLLRGGEHVGEAAEPVDQGLGEWFRISLRHREE
jgi:hypothetical protein